MMNLNDILSDSPLVQGGLTLMAAGWLGYQLRALPRRLSAGVRTVATRVIEIRDRSPLYDTWLGFVTEGAIRRGGPRTLEVRTTSRHDEDRAASARLAAGTDQFWARLCGKLCLVTIEREGVDSNHGVMLQRFMITVEVLLASRADMGRLLDEVKRRADASEPRQIIELCDKHGGSTTRRLPKRESSTLCLPRGLFESIERRVGDFRDSRESYERVGIPWRFGLLLHGAPGTGKTSLAHALASRFDLRLAVIPVADLRGDEELIDAFEAVSDESIVLLEDVDCAFRGRRAESAEGITFSGFLNCIDGVLAPHSGRVLIMSTNHVDRLDPALIRPGRIDMRIEVPLLTSEAATDYVDRVFPHVAGRHDAVSDVMAGENPTPARLINRIMQEDWRVGSRALPARSAMCQPRSRRRFRRAR